MSSPTSILIRQGQCEAFHARRGTTVVCTQGALRILEAPALLYEDLVWHRILLEAGQAHTVDKAGWLNCVAISDAHISVVEPPPSPALRLLAQGMAALGQRARKALAIARPGGLAS